MFKTIKEAFTSPYFLSTLFIISFMIPAAMVINNMSNYSNIIKTDNASAMTQMIPWILCYACIYFIHLIIEKAIQGGYASKEYIVQSQFSRACTFLLGVVVTSIVYSAINIYEGHFYEPDYVKLKEKHGKVLSLTYSLMDYKDEMSVKDSINTVVIATLKEKCYTLYLHRLQDEGDMEKFHYYFNNPSKYDPLDEK